MGDTLRPAVTEPLIIGRYMICDEIGAGGMATVHLGRILGAAGFSRVVAIKRLHASCAESDKFATMLIDEARIAARIRHPNVAPTLDVIRAEGELLLIMEYVHGPSLSWLQSRLLERLEPMPPRMAVRIALDSLAGLHAAHQAKSERGRPLGIVHRDVSPQNILVGEDGVARVLDFGIAKAEGRLSFSLFGEIKGKLRYMSPEQLRGESLDCRTDVFATGIVLWEMLAGRRLLGRPVDGEPANIMNDMLATLAELRGRLTSVSADVEEVVIKALSVDRAGRFASADEMAVALAATDAATAKELGVWTAHIARDLLTHRLEQIERIEQVSAIGPSVATSSRSALAAPPPTVATGASNSLLAPTESMNGRTLPLPIDPGGATKADLSPLARRMGTPDAPATLMSFHQASPSSVESTIVSASAATPRPARKPYAAFLVAAVLLAGVGGGAVVLRQARRAAAPTPALAVSSVASINVSEPSASARVATLPLTPAPSMSAVDRPVAAPASSAADGAPAVKPTATVRRTRASAAPSKPSCDPPFTVDRDGVRIPKADCVGE